MTAVNIRKQGGAAIITIPADTLQALAVSVGDTLEVEVTDGVLVARPARSSSRRRYSVADLLVGVTPSLARQMIRETSSVHSGPSLGREVP